MNNEILPPNIFDILFVGLFIVSGNKLLYANDHPNVNSFNNENLEKDQLIFVQSVSFINIICIVNSLKKLSLLKVFYNAISNPFILCILEHRFGDMVIALPSTYTRMILIRRKPGHRDFLNLQR